MTLVSFSLSESHKSEFFSSAPADPDVFIADWFEVTNARLQYPESSVHSLLGEWKKLGSIHLQLCQCWELVSTFGPPADRERGLIPHLALR